jgi:hypothetical protein
VVREQRLPCWRGWSTEGIETFLAPFGFAPLPFRLVILRSLPAFLTPVDPPAIEGEATAREIHERDGIASQPVEDQLLVLTPDRRFALSRSGWVPLRRRGVAR